MKSLPTFFWGAFALLLSGISPARGADNLLKNGEFEKKGSPSVPMNWEAFSSGNNQWYGGFSKDDASKGGRSVVFSNHGSELKFQGLFQSVKVKGGEQYQCFAHVKNNPDNRLAGGSRGQLSIEWIDARGKEISRLWSRAWMSHSADKWTKMVMSEVAPEKAVKANVVITLFSEGEASGGYLIDDVVFSRVK